MKVTGVALFVDDGVYDNQLFVFAFKDPYSSLPYQVKGMTGLDAEEVMAQYYGGLSGYTDHKRHNMVLGPRTITIRLGLNPMFEAGESYAQLRDNLYKIIASSRTGRLNLQFMNENEAVAVVGGHISKLEADPFSKTQEAQITLECKSPMLVGPTEISTTWTQLTSSSISVTESVSTAPHGFKFRFRFTQKTPSFTLQVDPAGYTFVLQPPSPGFEIGDTVEVESTIGKRHVIASRPGQGSMYFADSVQPGSIWPILFPGANPFRINPYGPTYGVFEEISYYPTYWGI